MLVSSLTQVLCTCKWWLLPARCKDFSDTRTLTVRMIQSFWCWLDGFGKNIFLLFNSC